MTDEPKLWLWKNFVNGKPEYWAFDNPYPIHMDNGDPQTLGEPCGYALFKPSRQGRTDVREEQVLRAVALANTQMVDWLGLALELEAQAKLIESKTAMRAMYSAARGLRLMGA